MSAKGLLRRIFRGVLGAMIGYLFWGLYFVTFGPHGALNSKQAAGLFLVSLIFAAPALAIGGRLLDQLCIYSASSPANSEEWPVPWLELVWVELS